MITHALRRASKYDLPGYRKPRTRMVVDSEAIEYVLLPLIALIFNAEASISSSVVA